ncbi:hypothetical protein GT370_12080 [Acidocella sp. MX-AZ03]|uniref:hypothetical protein n=1 Tax=Acidocella sp. MX-AZ03 TaxID=2697363 RepID=UPI0022DE2B99|nr:hypothetical protein [Acidocella sp. MX-AZ03]WBO58003.1 hypothetical protein GT370_12080 [Acidocella sp. MX-AZ03]
MHKPFASVRLADLTAPDFAVLAQRQPVILLALGSQEDHGPHQPMGILSWPMRSPNASPARRMRPARPA